MNPATLIISLILIICCSELTLAQEKKNIQRTNKPSEHWHDIIVNSASAVFYRLSSTSKGTTARSIMNYYAHDEYTLSTQESTQLKAILLTPASYLDENLARSCPFVADAAYSIVNDQGKEQGIVIISTRCKKIILLTPETKDLKKGEFLDLTTKSLEEIQSLVEQQKAFNEFSEDSVLHSVKPASTNSDVATELLLLERMIAKKNYGGLQKYHQEHYFVFLDTLIMAGNDIEEMHFLFRENKDFNDEQIFDSLINNEQLRELSQLQKNKKLKIAIIPIAAEVIDPVPPPTASKKEICSYYLNQITQILKKNKSLGYKIEDYLAYEQRNNITTEIDKIATRKKFIRYLNSKL